mgnify:FL=1
MSIKKNFNYKDYSKIAKEIDKVDSRKLLKKIHINFFSNFTAELLDSCIQVEFEAKGFYVKNSFFSYGSIDENILGNYNFSKEANQIFFFHFRTEDYFLDLGSDLLNNNKEKLIEIVDQKLIHLNSLFKTIRHNNSCNIFISNFSNVSLNLYETLENSFSFTQSDLINYINNELRILVNKFSSIYIFDYFSFTSKVGIYNLYDEKMWLMARFPFKSKYNAMLVKAYIRFILSSIVTPKKCLVCDLDNTLWGGTLGENNKNSISLGDDFPGNIYKNFQQTILNLKQMGVFLAVVSKNNEKDVYDFINGNQECLLKAKDFSLIKSNWKDKATNIIEISEELNIGLDSIVFFDDNPMEREWVKNQLPDVNVIDVPENPIYFKEALINSNFFDKTTITKEDKKRPQLFADEKSRKKHLKSFSKLYLKFFC